jgi:hypothetical protein
VRGSLEPRSRRPAKAEACLKNKSLELQGLENFWVVEHVEVPGGWCA